MFAHLNPRTRNVIEQLMAGGTAAIGGQTIAALTDDQRRLLHVLAKKHKSLERGADLVRQIERELAAVTALPTPAEAATSAEATEAKFWRFGRLRACSFRGLAPAGHVWEYNFAGRSHLFHGPNGCGKSSLMGAVAWNLTGKLFRDDCEPGQPECVDVYTTEEKAKPAGTRPCALALTDPAGVNTPSDAPFWVELELIPRESTATAADDRSNSTWIRRHRTEGLSASSDGLTWRKISSVEEVGISELDTELHVLMPARVPHLSFGKRPELVRLFSQVVGLDDLESIAEGGKSVHAAFTRVANSIEKETLAPLREQVAELGGQCDALAPTWLRTTAGHASITTLSTTLSADEVHDVERIGKLVSERLAAARQTLADSLGLRPPTGEAAEEGRFAEQLKLLPGQVQASVAQLDRPIEQLFPSALTAGQPSPDELARVTERLAAFTEGAVAVATARSKWADRERSEPDLRLMLAAAAEFDEADDKCPVCLRAMRDVPERRAALLDLKSVREQRNLQREVADLENALIAELHGIVPAAHVGRADKGMAQRVREDWTKLKGSACAGLLSQIAGRFDDRILNGAAAAAGSGDVTPASLPPGPVALPQGFARLAAAIAAAHRFVAWAAEMNARAERVRTELERLVKTDAASLRRAVEAGRALSDETAVLGQLHQLLGKLWKALREIAEQSAKARDAAAVAASASPIKDLGDLARKEAFDVVRRVDPEVKRHYAQLYGNEVLELDLITSGHAANRSVRTEINAYFKVGKERVPIAPFSNAGRLRGIMIAFVFALLKHSRNSIGLIVLDDPALSMDDEHKARFVDHLIAPVMAERQVLMATHYENFFKSAETHFRSGVRVNVVPKRSRADVVTFEPADLLTRLEQTLARPTAAWREAGNNLRIWAERTLAALSAYAPEPFVVFNNIPATVTAYRAVTDDRVATARRDRIAAALESPAFDRVRNRCAHDEEPAESDVRDALRALQGCADDVDYELKRLKALHRHSVLGRGLGRRPCVASLTIRSAAPPRRIEIKGRAAAAHRGTGVQWLEDARLDLPESCVVLALDQTVAPTCGRGDLLILDAEDAMLANADLAVVETEEGRRYLRRFWSDERGVQLESTNPTAAFEPVYLGSGRHRARKVAGVLFDGLPVRTRLEAGKEWTALDAVPAAAARDVVGVRVVGPSLEPLARDGQIILVRKAPPAEVRPGTLACVDIEDSGAVVKRCYPMGKSWVLNAMNPVEPIEPIVVAADQILHVYPVVGVLFSTGLGTDAMADEGHALAEVTAGS